MDQNIVISELHDYVLTLTLNRPKQLNALNKALIMELHQTLKKYRDNSEVRCVIITGAGNKSFVAGADIKEFSNFGPEEGMELARSGQELLFDYIEEYPKPIIAAINGFCLGGGMELALACHLRVASDNAKLGLPETTLGLIPGYGGTQRLAKLSGTGQALEMILTGEAISASEAFNCKILNGVYYADELLVECQKLAKKIAAKSPLAVTKALNSVLHSHTIAKAGFNKEIESFSSLFGSEDFKEGVRAFLEKRKPNFSGK